MKRWEDLAEGERVIMEARSSWRSYVVPVLWTAAYCVLVWDWWKCRRGVLYMCVLAALGVWSLHFFAQRLACRLVLTDRRVFGETGVLVPRVLNVPLDKVGGVYIEQNPLGRITGRGTVAISTAGSLFEFAHIPAADRFQEELMKQLELTQAALSKQRAEELASAVAAAQGRHRKDHARPRRGRRLKRER